MRYFLFSCAVVLLAVIFARLAYRPQIPEFTRHSIERPGMEPLRVVGITKKQIEKMKPTATGQLVFCRDCDGPKVCVANVTHEDIEAIARKNGLDVTRLPKSQRWITPDGHPCN